MSIRTARIEYPKNLMVQFNDSAEYDSNYFTVEPSEPVDTQRYRYIGLIFTNFKYESPYFEIKRLFYKPTSPAEFIERKLVLNSDGELLISREYQDEDDVIVPATVTHNVDWDLAFNGLRDRSRSGELIQYKGFTVFSDSVISSICLNSRKVSLSGIAVKYGQFAYVSNEDLQSEYFALKMEGDMSELEEHVEELVNEIKDTTNIDGTLEANTYQSLIERLDTLIDETFVGEESMEDKKMVKRLKEKVKNNRRLMSNTSKALIDEFLLLLADNLSDLQGARDEIMSIAIDLLHSIKTLEILKMDTGNTCPPYWDPVPVSEIDVSEFSTTRTISRNGLRVKSPYNPLLIQALWVNFLEKNGYMGVS